MGVASVIGALRVNLGLNSAGFRTGLNQSETRLQRFGRASKAVFGAMALAAAAVAGALGVMGKGSINAADEMSKLSARTGVAIGVLSQLAYAGKYSDTSIETLGGSLVKLTKTMAEIASGKGAAVKKSFDALGISVTNADGTLRTADQTFYAIADSFAAMPDGATKTALAIQFFGRSGAEMIPLLNSGSAGLRAMAAESDRLGFTLDETSGILAEQFNDNLTKVQLQFTGIVNKITIALLPALSKFSEWLSTLDPQTIAWAGGISGLLLLLGPTAGGIVAIANAAGLAAPAITTMAGAVGTLGGSLAALVAIPGALAVLAGGGWLAMTTEVGTGEDAFVARMNAEWEAMKELREKLGSTTTAVDTDKLYQGIYGVGTAVSQVATDAATIPPIFNDIDTAIGGAGAAADDLKTKTTEALEAAKDKAKELGETIKGAFRQGGEALRGLLDGTKTWNEALGDVLFSLAQMAFNNINFGGLSQGGNNMFGDVLSGLFGGLFGFKDGGSFKVGGTGGVDSQTVAFNASPDEVVSITKPGQGGGGQAVQINQEFNLDGAIGADSIANMVRRGASEAVDNVKRSLPGWQVQMNRNGKIS